MKLEVGMYVRTLNGKIWIIKSQQAISGHKKDILKASHNIIDLIEVGDYVNSKEVICNEKYELKLADIEGNWGIRFVEEAEIETIVTKEQFEAIKYEIK